MLRHFLLILAWISSVVNVPVCVRTLPQSEPSVRVSWLVYYTPAGMSSHWHWHSVPGCNVQRCTPSCTNSDDDNHQARRNAGEWVFVLPLLNLQLQHLLVCRSTKKISALFPRPFMHAVVGASVPEIFQIIKQTLMSEMTTQVNTECSFLMIIISIS